MEVEIEQCDASCAWEATGVCEDADGCTGSPRLAPLWSSEVCVRAGTFIRGGMGDFDEGPEAEIRVSSFYVDAYPVAYGRYAACIAAGGCDDPASSTVAAHLLDSAYTNRTVAGVTNVEATAFCLWDGGRRLPTEAEWEKAARGPSPRRFYFPWGDDMPRACWDIATRASNCDRAFFSTPAYDGFAGTRSYYGTYLQVGAAPEHVVDGYVANWYTLAASRVDDPVSTMFEVPVPTHVIRGGSQSELRGSIEYETRMLTNRQPGDGYSSLVEIGFRCARGAS